MPNHLSIPFKQTLGVDIKKAIEEYFDAGHLQAHPDAFAWDIGHWAALRVEASSTSVHQSKIDVLLR
jgi:programmed cell death 6-interacting protein